MSYPPSQGPACFTDAPLWSMQATKDNSNRTNGRTSGGKTVTCKDGQLLVGVDLLSNEFLFPAQGSIVKRRRPLYQRAWSLAEEKVVLSQPVGGKCSDVPGSQFRSSSCQRLTRPRGVDIGEAILFFAEEKYYSNSGHRVGKHDQQKKQEHATAIVTSLNSLKLPSSEPENKKGTTVALRQSPETCLANQKSSDKRLNEQKTQPSKEQLLEEIKTYYGSVPITIKSLKLMLAEVLPKYKVKDFHSLGFGNLINFCEKNGLKISDLS